MSSSARRELLLLFFQAAFEPRSMVTWKGKINAPNDSRSLQFPEIFSRILGRKYEKGWISSPKHLDRIRLHLFAYRQNVLLYLLILSNQSTCSCLQPSDLLLSLRFGFATLVCSEFTSCSCSCTPFYISAFFLLKSDILSV